MHSLKATVVLSAFLSAGILMAQQTNSNPAPDPGIAQPAPEQPARHAPNADKQARHLARQLGLSADQESKIQPILSDRIQQMENLRADSSLSPRNRRRKMREITQDSNSKIEALLNDSQKQQYEQMLAQRRAHHKGASPAVPQG